MKDIKTPFTDIAGYISQFPTNTRQLLLQMQLAIKQAAPDAEEVISYNMPAFRTSRVLVWFAGYKAHIGLYPTGLPIVFFKKELIPYKTSKGAIQFPLDKKLPITLIKKIVRMRVKETAEKAKAKLKKRSSSRR